MNVFVLPTIWCKEWRALKLQKDDQQFLKYSNRPKCDQQTCQGQRSEITIYASFDVWTLTEVFDLYLHKIRTAFPLSHTGSIKSGFYCRLIYSCFFLLSFNNNVKCLFLQLMLEITIGRPSGDVLFQWNLEFSTTEPEICWLGML